MGDGRDFTIVDIPGLKDPSGTPIEKLHVKSVVDFLKYDVEHITAIIHVVKGSWTRHHAEVLKKNLQLFKFMFGEAMFENFITEVLNEEQNREDFRARIAHVMQQIIQNSSITSDVVFVRPEAQENELNTLQALIWGNQATFTCGRNCRFVDQILDPINNYPTIEGSGYEVSALIYHIGILN